MKTTSRINIITPDDLEIAAKIARHRFETQGKLTVIIKKYERNISDEQRSLYWMWLGVMTELGSTKEELHKGFKERFLLNIYLADLDNHPVFTGLAENMLIVRRKAPEQYPAIRVFVMAQLSIMDATIDNMRQYLTEIENEARSLRIKLPMPEMQGLI
jgi:hypothetical protein